MRRTPVILLAVAAVLALAAPSARAAKPPSVPQALARLQAAGHLDAATAAADLETYRRATATVRRLHGVRRTELGAVLRTVDRLAAGGRLSPSRVPAVFLTLDRNRDWWANRPIPSSGQRERFAPSQLLWQYYPGQGMQIQWLGTFGKANALWQAGRDEELRALLDEAVALATRRAGGVAFEYLFTFDGGRPPWVSALAQGTGLTALARGAARLNAPAYLEAAHLALGIFRTAPPTGVRVDTDAGAHYLQYSYAPSLHIVNGFTQSLNGLYDLATLGRDADAATLFDAGERQLRAELPTFDTGAWSLYAVPGSESTLGYHVLLRDFLKGLCGRLSAPVPPAPAGSPTVADSGGTVAQPAPAAAVPAADPAPYCTTAQRFTADLRTPPTVAIDPGTWRAGRTGRLGLRLSKIASVAVTVSREGTVVLSRTVTLGRGRRTLDVRPRRSGPLDVHVRAVDLAGNAADAQATMAVLPAARKHRRAAARG